MLPGSEPTPIAERGVAADIIENSGEKIGATVDHLGMVAERRYGIDEAKQLDDAHNAAEIARGGMHDGEQVQAGETGMAIGLLDRDVVAHLAV